MAFNVDDRIKQKYTRANRLGTVIGVYGEDFYIESNGEQILFAVAGEYKVKFDSDPGIGYSTLSGEELSII